MKQPLRSKHSWVAIDPQLLSHRTKKMPLARFQRLSVEKRKNILDNAAEVFAENGYEGSSFNQIVERCGLSKGAMYYYFENKEDLYLTVLESAARELVQKMEFPEIPENAEGYWEVLRKMYIRSMEICIADPRLANLARGLLHIQKSHQVTQAYQRLLDGSSQWFMELLVKGQEVDAIRKDLPQDLLLSVVMGLGQGIDLWILERWETLNSENLEAFCDLSLSLFKRLIKPLP